MLSIIKNIVIIVGLLLTIGLGYFLYLGPGAVDDSNAGLQLEITFKANRFLQQLEELKQIDISGDVLSDARFSSLRSFSGPIESEPVGRENPFIVN